MSIQQILGIGAQSVNWYQAAIRAVIVYIATLVMVRVGEKRFLGIDTAFDVVVGILLGSLVSTAINALGDIVPTLVAGFVIVGLHWLFAVITFRSNLLDNFLKGTSTKVIKNGEIQWKAMRKYNIADGDLMMQLRMQGNTEDVRSVKEAYFERSGEISVIKENPQPVILEVKVEDGVQTVRIVMEQRPNS